MKNELAHTLTESFEGHAITDYFADVGEMVDLGSGSQREISDIMLPRYTCAPTIILKAKNFAAEITDHNIREHAMNCEPQILQEDVTNNQAVRQTMIDRGIRPESLPPAGDVKKVERRLTSAEKKALKNPDGLEE